MARSTATTADEYLAEITDDVRHALVSRLRDFIGEQLPAGYVEGIGFGMIAWQVPLEVSGPTYNGQPLAVVALANQKQYVSVYLMGAYGDDEVRERFESDWKATGTRLDLGKSCLRIRREDEVVWDALGDALAALDVDAFLGMHDAAHG